MLDILAVNEFCIMKQSRDSRPTHQIFPQVLDKIENDMSTFSSMGEIMLIGDFDAHMSKVSYILLILVLMKIIFYKLVLVLTYDSDNVLISVMLKHKCRYKMKAIM